MTCANAKGWLEDIDRILRQMEANGSLTNGTAEHHRIYRLYKTEYRRIFDWLRINNCW